MTIRRALALVLLLSGVGLTVRMVQHPLGDAPRSLAVMGLAAGGITCNVVALVRRDLPVRPWFRVLACAAGGLMLAGLLAMRHRVGVAVLPGVPLSDIALRATLMEWQSTLLHLSFAVGYFALSIAVLPSRRV